MFGRFKTGGVVRAEEGLPRPGEIIVSLSLPKEATAEQIRERRERTGKSLQEVKRDLDYEHLCACIQQFDLTGERKLLTHILFKLANRTFDR